MQQRYVPGADARPDPENGLLDAFELQVRALVGMGLGAHAARRARRVFELEVAADAAGERGHVLPAEIEADGLDLARLLRALVACERRAAGWREKQTIQAGRAWLADEMRRAVAAKREKETA